MKVLTVIPTYCELENLPLILDRLRSVAPEVDVLIVDDNSPDGTGVLADKFAAKDTKIHTLHRKEKAGIGSAYMVGFKWGLQNGFQVLVEMDADGSHQPEDLELILNKIYAGSDLVLGSRWISGGNVVGWSKHRELLSRAGNFYARTLLGVKVKDITGGYRAFRSTVFDELDLDKVSSQSYSFQTDLAWQVIKLGKNVCEVPITFTNRQFGSSKMNSKVFFETLWKVTFWGVGYRFGGFFKKNS